MPRLSLDRDANGEKKAKMHDYEGKSVSRLGTKADCTLEFESGHPPFEFAPPD